MHKKIAAVVQRLVPMLAMHMMAVRFRSVAPMKNQLTSNVVSFYFYYKDSVILWYNKSNNSMYGGSYD